MSPVGLVLAAGSGRRFGSPKALVGYQGERLVDRAVRLLRDGGCARVIAVSGAAGFEVAGAEVVHNPSWESGMGSSLRAGLEYARREYAEPEHGGTEYVGERDVVVVPVDMPWLGSDSVRRVVAAATYPTYPADPASPLAVATYGGRWGHPVLIGAGHARGVADSAVGDVGARRYLRAHRAAVVEVPCDGTGSPRDVDVPGDLADGCRAGFNTCDTSR